MPQPHHEPVMLREVLAAAAGARRVVDATLGDGGHAAAFLAAGAEVLGLDRDPDAIRIARARLGDRGLSCLQASFGSPEGLRAAAEFRPDFIFLDLGVSSRQLDEDARGFTFRPGAPLDMRMGDAGPTAADLLNERPQQELRTWLSEWGDEPRALRLAGEIVRRRERGRFATSDDLVNAIRAVLGPRSGPDDFARIFQAIRIAVNEELGELERALPALRDALAPEGTLAVVSYHSGEDRVVKHAFHEWSRACICPPAQPVCTCRGRALGRAVPRGGHVPTPDEIAANPRARSARLRLFRTAA
jgi:16S rRNA (cytosine1402-N4)-methyltransferase